MSLVLKNTLLSLMVFALLFAAFGYLSKLLKAFGEKEKENEIVKF